MASDYTRRRCVFQVDSHVSDSHRQSRTGIDILLSMVQGGAGRHTSEVTVGNGLACFDFLNGNRYGCSDSNDKYFSDLNVTTAEIEFSCVTSASVTKIQ